MAFIDHHDVFVGSTDDGHTFVVINYPIRAAHRILLQGGFTAREHQGRTVYLLPPSTTTAPEAHHRAGEAVYQLLAHTMDLVDLRSTTHSMVSGSLPEAAARFHLRDGRVTATAYTATAREVLQQHGFVRTRTGYALTGERGERESVGVVARAEAHLWSLGLDFEITLGIPTPDAISLAPGRSDAPGPAPARPPQAPTAHPRTR